jgi:hypothetical protein
MSDGPHRSLPMRRHWRRCLELAQNPAHSPAELREVFSYALSKEISAGQVAKVREILNGDLLFPEMRVQRLEALRAEHPGSAGTNSLIDCTIAVIADGAVGDAGTSLAVEAAYEDCARAHIRGMDEHTERVANDQVRGTVRARLDEVFSQTDRASLVREAMSPPGTPRRAPARQTGLDAGPPL